jgi:glyoxylase-like metal-dependent hydrolase (beta-lactamase superfamily II)
MVTTLDLNFQGRSGVIAAGLLEGPEGLALVDPGPASCLDALRAALSAQGRALEEIETILVTHIHLDHSGAVGVIARSNPHVEVYVHRRGAPHIVDPTKLLSSANRLYGEAMDRLWGEVAPVPSASVHPLDGGEVLRRAGLELRVADTPGHASHHVSYLDTSSGTAFVGDTGGIRIGAPLLVIPPTPPPDIDLEAWRESLARIRAWAPESVFVTHFGRYERPLDHLADLEARLQEMAGWVRTLLDDSSLDDEERKARFAARMTRTFEQALPDEGWVERYTAAVPVDHCWQGLARYWRKRQGVSNAS